MRNLILGAVLIGFGVFLGLAWNPAKVHATDRLEPVSIAMVTMDHLLETRAVGKDIVGFSCVSINGAQTCFIATKNGNPK